MYTMLALVHVCVDGKRQYLVSEDMTDIEYLATYLDAKPWKSYIDELLSRRGDISNIEAVLIYLLHTTVAADEWCRIPYSYIGLYNYSTENTKTTLLSNISQWLPCGVVVTQKYISPSTPEDTINIKVNAQLHINVTFIELHMDSIILEADNPFFLERGNHFSIYLM